MKSWIIRTLLTPPDFPGDEMEILRAKLLHYALLANVALMVLCVTAALVGNLPALVIELEIGFAAASLVLRHWLFQGRIRLASGVFVGLGCLVITAAIARLGTIRGPATGFYMPLVIAAGVFFGLRGLLIMIGLGALAVAGLIGAENAGLLPRPEYAVTITQWIATTALFATVGFWTLATIQTISAALLRSSQEIAERKQHELTIQRQTEELRVKNASLTRINGLYIGRELRMVELKREMNDLCRKAGEAPRYPTLVPGSDPATIAPSPE
jgi:hypothetical protein